MKTWPAAALLALLIAPAVSTAQNIPKDLVFDFRNGVADILTVWVSPFRGHAHDYEGAALSLGSVGVAAFADAPVANWVRGHQNAGVLKAVEPFRQSSGLDFVNSGDGGWSTQGAAAIYGVGLLVRSRPVRDIGMGCLAGAEATSIVRQAVYDAVSRERPLFVEQVNGTSVTRAGRPYDLRFPGRNGWFDNAFFAGHVTTVMSCVSFINHRYHLGYAGAVLWAFGAGIGLGRIADQRHYTSDVLLGGLFGFATGKLVGERSRARAQRTAGKRTGNAPAADSAASKFPKRSWLDGFYVSDAGGAMQIGWRTQP